MIKYLQLPTCQLAEFVAEATTSFDVAGFMYNDGVTPVGTTDIGDICYATMESKTPREELISFTIDSVTSDGVATITATRGLLQKSPYTTGGASFDHQNGSNFIISNNPGLFNHLTAKDNEEVITEQWAFPDPTTDGAPVTKSYLEDTVESTLVHVTGDEAIEGIKTFIEPVVIPDAVADDEATSKGQVDALDAANVKKTGNQSIDGVKTFTSSPIVPNATAAQHPITKSQYDAGAAAYAADAGPTVQGAVKIDTVADDPSDPVALTATADRVDALAGGGTFGTPDSSNKFLTENYFASAALFGDGSDGNGNISGTTTLTKDMYYNNLVVTGTLNTAGYRVFVAGTLSGTGTIQNNGNAGSAAVTNTLGAGGTATVGYFTNSVGTGGGASVGSGTNGNGGTATSNIASLLITTASSVGGKGGDATGTTGGGGGTSGTRTGVLNYFGVLRFLTLAGLDIASTGSLIKAIASMGGTGGGSGSSATGGGNTGAGGGGGASGGIVAIFVNAFTGTVTIKSTGGTGGVGGNAPGTSAGGGGGGAGGNGGYIYVVYNTKTWTGSYVVTGGAGGVGGTGVGSGATGATGATGSVGLSKEIQMTHLI